MLKGRWLNEVWMDGCRGEKLGNQAGGERVSNNWTVWGWERLVAGRLLGKWPGAVSGAFRGLGGGGQGGRAGRVAPFCAYAGRMEAGAGLAIEVRLRVG